LKQASYKIAEEIYKQQGAAGGQPGGPGGADPNTGAGGSGQSAPGNDNTKGAEDADYEVVDDDKK
jgi:molecular chaperone DnaK